jgi:hypothetical protein
VHIHGVSDLDMVFELPAKDFERFTRVEGNGPSQMLQEVKNCLKTRYRRRFTGSKVVLPSLLSTGIEVGEDHVSLGRCATAGDCAGAAIEADKLAALGAGCNAAQAVLPMSHPCPGRRQGAHSTACGRPLPEAAPPSTLP